MNVSAFGSLRIAGAAPTAAPPGGRVAGASDPDGDGDSHGGSSVRISRGAKIASQLQQLKAADPAKFKEVVTDIASKLTDAAKSATGKEQQFLQKLADKFTAAESGDLSGFQAPATSANATPAQVYQQTAQATDPANQALASSTGGHHHHGGGGAVGQTLSAVFQELSQALSGSSAASAGAPAATVSATA